MKEIERKLRSVINSTNVLTSTRDLDKVLHLLIKESLNVFYWADSGVLFLYDNIKQGLVAKRAIGFDLQLLSKIVLHPNESMSGKAFYHERPMLFQKKDEVKEGMANLRKENRELFNDSLLDDKKQPISSIAAPLITNGKCFGVLIIDSFSQDILFDHEDLNILTTFANQAVVAIENASLFSKNERAKYIHNELTNMYMSNKGIQGITSTLSHLINKDVLVFNRLFELIASSSTSLDEKADLLNDDNIVYVKQQLAKEEFVKVRVNKQEYAYLFAIQANEKKQGYLSILADSENILDEMDMFIVKQIAVVFYLEFFSEYLRIFNQFHRESLLLQQLIKDPQANKHLIENKVENAADYIYLFLTMDISQISVEQGLSKDDYSEILYQSLYGFEYPSMVIESAYQYSIIFIIHHDEGSIYLQKIERWLEQLIQKTEITMFVGIGREFVDIEQIVFSLNDSIKSAKFAKLSNSSNLIYNYNELGIYRLFMGMDDKELQLFYKDRLEKLIRYDRENNTQFLHTLNVYLKTERSIKKTSKQLFLHENTVKYRIKRSFEILGIEMSGNTVFEVRLAILIYDYFNEIDSSYKTTNSEKFIF